jgi:O-methyltransferase
MLRYAVDELNSDRVVGWAFDGAGEPDVLVVVDGEPVGPARIGAFRADVAQSLEDDRAKHCGFEFRFRTEHFQHATEGRASVMLRIGDDQTPTIMIPVLSGRPQDSVPRGPLPPDVLRLLRSYRSDYDTDSWDPELMDRAVADLRFLLARGPRAVPALHRHLTFLAQLWMRARSVERYFPRENDRAGVHDKDRSGVQNSALEVFCVAAHLATLTGHGVTGPFLEFGCFKGFSTAILSDACHQLDLDMHVFDSFAGLPPSASSYYSEGDFAGSRAEVERNVAAYGSPRPVTYHEGFFADTVPKFGAPRIGCIWMDVDLESSSRDVMTVFPRLDPGGALFSHEAPADIFSDGKLRLEDAPEAVVPPIVEAFASADRPLAARHVHGHTSAFWDARVGIPPLATPAMLGLRDLALAL